MKSRFCFYFAGLLISFVFLVAFVSFASTAYSQSSVPVPGVSDGPPPFDAARPISPAPMQEQPQSQAMPRHKAKAAYRDESETETLSREYRPRRFEFSLSGGFAFGTPQFVDAVYQHQIIQSPIVRFGFQTAFFAERHFHLLVGGDLIYFKSDDVNSSPLATASLDTEEVSLAPTVGVGWSPWGADAQIHFQGTLATGIDLSRSLTLHSPGFSTTVQTYDNNEFAYWLYLLAIYEPTPGWRVSFGPLLFEQVFCLTAGAAYAF